VGWPAPTHIWLSDANQAVRLSVSKGITVSARHRDRCDVEMSSAALAYMLNNTWGGMTLIINGRFTKPAGGDFERFMRYVRNADSTNHGKTMVMAATTRVASVVPFMSSLLGPLIGE
jgi:hypothetical protein